ncbi:hypothetical protein LAY56_22775, partial [Escherichia coli]|nr:hypothetical protein [Escherichia coli]
ILTFQNHTNRPLTDFGGKTSIFSHPVYLFLREFSLQDFRGGSKHQFRDKYAREGYQLQNFLQLRPTSTHTMAGDTMKLFST